MSSLDNRMSDTPEPSVNSSIALPAHRPVNRYSITRSLSQSCLSASSQMVARPLVLFNDPRFFGNLNSQPQQGMVFHAQPNGRADVPFGLVQQSFPVSSSHEEINQLSYSIQANNLVIVCNDQVFKQPPVDMHEDDDVSEDFVTQFNSHIGNENYYNKAQRLLTKMRKLGNLEELAHGQRIDIPSARLGLCILTGLRERAFKEQALDSLLELLNLDKIENKSADELISLTIQLMTYLTKQNIQQQVPAIQIKFAQVYNTLMVLLLLHYKEKHLNGIDEELKNHLITISKAFGGLNTQQDAKLSFYLKSALEGNRRLSSDCRPLYWAIERFYLGFTALIALHKDDVKFCFSQLERSLKDLDLHFSKVWYNWILLFKKLENKALEDMSTLEGILVILSDKHLILNWKFTYASIEILSNIVLNGRTEAIRRRALEGLNGTHFSGLAALANCQELALYDAVLEPLSRFEKPFKKDPNIPIRLACAEQLIKIVQQTQDPFIKSSVEYLLKEQLGKEKELQISCLLRAAVPEQPEIPPNNPVFMLE